MSNSISVSIRPVRRRWFYGLMSVVVAFGIVVGTPQASQAISWVDLILRGIQVIQLSSLSDSQEVSLGEKINEQLVNEEFQLYNNREVREYVDEVGQQLVPDSTRPDIPYVFQVVRDDSVNAFATMGGYVYVTTGLLKAADNEAELAGVIGHEIGHIAARHSVKQMRELAIAQGIATAAGLDTNTAVAIGVELALRRPHSREAEFEADQLGLENMRQSGYAPIAMVTFMEKLLGGGSIPAFLSTHPATSDRIEALNAMIDANTASAGEGLNESNYRSRISDLL